MPYNGRPWKKDTPDSVRAYLEALALQDWDRLGRTLASDIVRIGPYRDLVEGSGAYREFLAGIVSQLPDYELRVQRVTQRDGVVCVQLSETITDGSGRRLRTGEVVVFDLDEEGKIARVEVYTQKSDHPDAR